MGTRRTNVEKEPDMKGCKITVNSRMLQSGVIMTTTMIAPETTEEELQLFRNSLCDIGTHGMLMRMRDDDKNE